MTKFFIIVITFLIAIFLQWSWGGWMSHAWGFSPPLVPFLAIILFWRMKLLQRMWLVGLAGAFLDIFSLHPWGTHIGLFFLVAILTTILQFLFTNTESLLVQGISATCLLLVFFNLVYPLALFINFLGGKPQFSSPAVPVFTASLFWAVLLPAVFMILARPVRKAKIWL